MRLLRLFATHQAWTEPFLIVPGLLSIGILLAELVLVNLLFQFEGLFFSELMSEYRSSSFFLIAFLL